MSFRSTSILLAALLVLGGLVYFLEFRNPPEPTVANVADTKPQILSLTNDDINYVEVRGEGDRVTSLRKGDDAVWKIEKPEPFEANASAVNNVIIQLAPLRADRLIEEKASDLATFGLDNPQWEIKVGVKNGDPQSVQVGFENATRDGLYVKRPNDDVVYLVTASTMGPLKQWLSIPPRAIPTPTPSPTVDTAATSGGTPSPVPAVAATPTSRPTP